MATLRRASLSAPFFQQHVLTSCLCHILVILARFQTLLLCIISVTLICDVTIVIVLGRHEPCPYKTANLIDKCCVCSDFTDRPFLHLSPEATAAFSNHHPDQSAAIIIKARPSISKKITTRLKLK
jgi:hypothetical protein